MKSKATLAIALTVLLGAAVGAQSAGGDDDARKLRQELDTMKGILRTSLRYAIDKPARDEVVFEQEIDAYYLPRQGAVFIVPVHLGGPESGFPLQIMEAYLSAAEGQRELSERVLRDLEREMEQVARDAQAAVLGIGDELVWSIEGEAPEAPEAPEPPPAPEAPDAVEAPAAPPPPPPGADSSRRVVVPRVRVQLAENARLRLDELRARFEKQKQESEERRREREATFAKIRESMMESLSKHGDSLSILDADESITLILKRGSTGLRFGGPMLAGGGEDDGSTVLSVKKSDVTAYKSGRIDHAQFLARVVESKQ